MQTEYKQQQAVSSFITFHWICQDLHVANLSFLMQGDWTADFCVFPTIFIFFKYFFQT